MNPGEHELNYPDFEIPTPGQVVALRDGVRWVRMPLPFALDHINLWLLDDEIDGVRGWTQIDTGITSQPTQEAWETIFDQHFEGRPLLRVICTHMHPDHFGLAWWLTTGGARKRWNVPLWMTMSDYALGRLISMGNEQTAGASMAEHFRRHGLANPKILEAVRARGASHFPRLVPATPASFRRIGEGDRIAIGPHGAKRVFRVIIGNGHAPEHASLACEEDKLLISGDMVLPRISTNVSVYDLEPEADPLVAYLRSLDRFLGLAEDTFVLPSHGRPFFGLHPRIAQQHAHHRDRLAEVLAACARPMTAFEIVPVLFKRALDVHQTTFALGEAIAHLHALWHDGNLGRSADANGVLRFLRV